MIFTKSVVPCAVVLGVAASTAFASPLPHFESSNLVSQLDMMSTPHRSFHPSDFKSYGDWAMAEMSPLHHTVDSDNSPQSWCWKSVKGLFDGAWRTLTNSRETIVSADRVAVPFDIEAPLSRQDEIINPSILQGQLGESIVPQLEKAMLSIEGVLGREAPWYRIGSLNEPRIEGSSLSVTELQAWNRMLEQSLGHRTSFSEKIEQDQAHAPTFVKRSSLTERSPAPAPSVEADGWMQRLQKRFGLFKLFKFAFHAVKGIVDAVRHKNNH